jgi:hypothetical protein
MIKHCRLIVSVGLLRLYSYPSPNNEPQMVTTVLCDNGASEHHQNNALKAVLGYAKFLKENTTFYDINTKE